VYTFGGATAGGERFRGQATLSHKLPPTAKLLRPAPEAEGVAARGLKITWAPVESVAAYVIEIEQDELDVNVTATLAGTATTFAVPDGFLRGGTEYDLAIGTVTADGNISFVESSFTTAEMK
jgi:hypothetical protein